MVRDVIASALHIITIIMPIGRLSLTFSVSTIEVQLEFTGANPSVREALMRTQVRAQ
ncbi:hypothetical protein L0244_07905 [bacterium]|nr:hypothetical protein [bacterium]